MDEKTSNVLDALYDLVERIKTHGGKLKEASMLERYKYFRDHSEYKENCPYAAKCRELFMQYDYKDVTELFLKVLEKYRIIEGDKFGR